MVDVLAEMSRCHPKSVEFTGTIIIRRNSDVAPQLHWMSGRSFIPVIWKMTTRVDVSQIRGSR